MRRAIFRESVLPDVVDGAEAGFVEHDSPEQDKQRYDGTEVI